MKNLILTALFAAFQLHAYNHTDDSRDEIETQPDDRLVSPNLSPIPFDNEDRYDGNGITPSPIDTSGYPETEGHEVETEEPEEIFGEVQRTEIIMRLIDGYAVANEIGNHIRNRVIARWGHDDRFTPRAHRAFDRIVQNIHRPEEVERVVGLLGLLVQMFMNEEIEAEMAGRMLNPGRMFASGALF